MGDNDTGDSDTSDVDVIESVLNKTATVLAGVRPDQLTAPTPCAEYDVRALENHIVGWVQSFAAAASGRPSASDPAAYLSADPVGDFRAAVAELVEGWRSGGVDRTVSLAGNEVPAPLALTMTLMEYVTHACDLAVATGQPVPFSDSELAMTLERARVTLPDQYRGEGMAFGHQVAVAADAPLAEQLLGFMGRRP